MNTYTPHKAEYQTLHRQRNFALLMEYLAEHPCVDCGYSNIIALDFDHLPGVEKKFEIGRAVSGSTRSWKTIRTEMEKCEVVCANCHRIRTATRAQQVKYLVQEGLHVPVVAKLKPLEVGHGEGVKGKRHCPCGLCKEARRAYAARRRAAS